MTLDDDFRCSDDDFPEERDFGETAWVALIPVPMREAAEAVVDWCDRTPHARRLVDSLTMLDNGNLSAVHNPNGTPLVATIYWSMSDHDWRFLRLDNRPPEMPTRFDTAAEAIHEAFTAMWTHTHPPTS